MHSSTITVVAALAITIAAKSCHSGGMYCGQSLLNRGNYENHIIQVLEAEGQQTTETYIDNSLFSCGSGGDITYVQYCDNGCNGVGSDDADACLTA